MSFDMFKNAVDSCLPSVKPNDWYRNLQQAFIDREWDNTTAIKTIGEQKVYWNQEDYFEKFTFVNMETWVKSVVGQSSTGSKTGRDFLALLFRDINHPIVMGRYYIIDNEYYISYFDDRVVDVDANLAVRRCNTWMKIVDPLSGAIYQIPAVVDYDMSAPSNRVATSIITPNNHASVKVQKNAATDRLFKTNTRFILGGRPFKITGMQNAIAQYIDNELPGLLELDLFLDEIWDNDDLELGIADNGEYDYSILIHGGDLSLINGANGYLHDDVMLNGTDVERTVVWSSSDASVVTVTSDGYYEVVGAVGESAAIKATLYNNPSVFAEIIVSVVDSPEDFVEVVLNPPLKFIREYETVKVAVLALYNGDYIDPATVTVDIPTACSGCLSYTQDGDIFYFTCSHRISGEVTLTFTVDNEDPAFTATKSIDIKLTSLLG